MTSLGQNLEDSEVLRNLVVSLMWSSPFLITGIILLIIGLVKRSSVKEISSEEAEKWNEEKIRKKIKEAQDTQSKDNEILLWKTLIEKDGSLENIISATKRYYELEEYNLCFALLSDNESKNNIDINNLLALLYSKGLGCSKNIDKAIELYIDSFNQKSIDALEALIDISEKPEDILYYCVISLYSKDTKGHRVKPSFDDFVAEIAIKDFKNIKSDINSRIYLYYTYKAHIKNHYPATLAFYKYLRSLYSPFTIDNDLILEVLEPIAIDHDDAAREIINHTSDKYKKAKYAEILGNKGDASLLLLAAGTYESLKEYVKAANIYQRLFEKSKNLQAKEKFYALIWNGYVSNDRYNSIGLYEEGASKGYNYAKLVCGDFYFKKSNYNKAFRYYTSARDLSNLQLHRLGYMYAKGLGTAVNYRFAFDYFEQSTHGKAIPESYEWLGYFYDQGIYVGRDIFKAKDYYQKAYNSGISCGNILNRLTRECEEYNEYYFHYYAYDDSYTINFDERWIDSRYQCDARITNGKMYYHTASGKEKVRYFSGSGYSSCCRGDAEEKAYHSATSSLPNDFWDYN